MRLVELDRRLKRNKLCKVQHTCGNFFDCGCTKFLNNVPFPLNLFVLCFIFRNTETLHYVTSEKSVPKPAAPCLHIKFYLEVIFHFDHFSHQWYQNAASLFIGKMSGICFTHTNAPRLQIRAEGGQLIHHRRQITNPPELSIWSQRENTLMMKWLLASDFQFSWETFPPLLSLKSGWLLRPFTGTIAHEESH